MITTHINPDGDSVASALAFAALLKHLDKQYTIVLNDPVPAKFDFLPGYRQIHRYSSKSDYSKYTAATILDSSDHTRLGEVSQLLNHGMPIVNIDHHPSNLRYGDINHIEESASSAVEIVYDILVHFNVPFDKTLATLIYTGIMCDTGRFLFPNTSHHSFSICSEMVRCGAQPDQIAENIYFRSSQSTVRALSEALSNLEFHFHGQVASIFLPYSYCSHADKPDTEGFVDHLLAIESTEVEFFMLEKEPGVFKVSFRSKNCVDVNQVAKELGGGGHVRASGCTLQGAAPDVRARILEVLARYFNDTA